MTSSDRDNPFQSPGDKNDRGVDIERIVSRAKLAWQLPAVGLMLFVLLYFHEALSPFRGAIRLLPSLVFLLGATVTLIAGAIFTVYGIYYAQRLPRVANHALAGITLSFLLLGMVYIGWVLLSRSTVPYRY